MSATKRDLLLCEVPGCACEGTSPAEAKVLTSPARWACAYGAGLLRDGEELAGRRRPHVVPRTQLQV